MSGREGGESGRGGGREERRGGREGERRDRMKEGERARAIEGVNADISRLCQGTVSKYVQ